MLNKRRKHRHYTVRNYFRAGEGERLNKIRQTGTTVLEAILASVRTSDGSLVDLPESFKLSTADLVIKQ